MALDDAIIARGYFPAELPPPFHSRSLAKAVAAQGLSSLNKAWKSQKWTRGLRHSLARPGGLRRSLTIPNPTHFLRLAEAIASAWLKDIRPVLKKATLATSRPTPSTRPRAFAPAKSNKRSEIEALSRSGGRYLLVADIQNFFPSIYTHSIPWVMHGKAIAKANQKSPALIGNVIDKAVREGQDGQTMGVPIGPDTSWVIAEMLMARVEEAMSARFPRLRGHRFNDDISLVARTPSEAEGMLDALQTILADFELSLNPLKTRVVDLPSPIEELGVAELRAFAFRPGTTAQKSDLIAYFDRVAELMRESHRDHLASYALARLRQQKIRKSSWELLESLILQFLVAEPSCAKQAAMSLSMLSATGLTLSKDLISDAAEALVVRHAPLGHSSEVSWALWLCLAADAPLSAATAGAISQMDDSIVALLALHAKASGLVPTGLNTSVWEQAMYADELTGPRWLLSYEARQKAWLPSVGAASGDHRDANPVFKALAAAGVSFYDTAALTLSYQPHILKSTGGASPYAHLFT